MSRITPKYWYDESVTNDLSDGFFHAVRTTSEHLRCQPIDLLSVMMSESGVCPAAHSVIGDTGGLIQFMPQTLINLGWTEGRAAFRVLSAEQQMPYVEAYLGPFSSKGLYPAARLYQAVLLPATLAQGSDMDTVICGEDGPFTFAYGLDISFDIDRKGTITVGDLQSALNRACRGPRWAEIVSRLAPTTTPFS